MRHAIIVFFVSTGLAFAQSAPEATDPPPARPDPEEREEEFAPSPPEEAAAGEAAEEQTDETVIEDAGPDEAPPEPDKPPVPDMLAEDDASFVGCQQELDALGTLYELAEPIEGDLRDCGIARPIAVMEILPGVELNPDARMRCETALALAQWTADFVLPAARILPERGKLTGIDHGSTYVCRARAGGGKLSEHAFGNAIDVMGFRFADGPAVAVEPREKDGTPAEAFQDAVRATACLTFTTVLGPGSDAAHADHLHLDVKKRRGDFRICQ